MPKKSSSIIVFVEVSLLILVLGLLFLSYKVSAQEDIPLELTNDTFKTEILTKNSEIFDLQYDYFQDNGKYQSSFPSDKKLPYSDLSDTEIIIHEYVTPKGEAGYQIFYINNGYTKAYGYGEEAGARTFDWDLIDTTE